MAAPEEETMAEILQSQSQPELPAGKSAAAAEVSTIDASMVCNSGMPPPLESPSASSKGKGASHSVSTKSVAAHKGHRNLAIRSTTAFCQGIVSASLIDVKETYVPVAFLNFCAATTLAIQFRTGNPLMFALRGSCSWLLFLLLVYNVMCGKTWAWDYNEMCVSGAWHDERAPLRIIHVVGCLRLFLNGTSLFCQFTFPHRMFADHGNEQLFFRGCVQASGVVLHVLLFAMKRSELDGTKWERSNHEEVSHFFRILFIAISSWSLFHQWWHTSVGHTGHALSDAYEHKRRNGHGLCHSLCHMHVHMLHLHGHHKVDGEGHMHCHHDEESKVDGEGHGEEQKEPRKDDSSPKDELRETSPADAQIPPSDEVDETYITSV